MSILLSTLAALCATVHGGEAPESASLSALAPERAVWLRAPHVSVGDGRVLERAWVVVESGVIKAVGADLSPREGAVTIELEGWLAPGLIALRSQEGTDGDRLDATRPVMADLDIAKAFRPERAALGRTLAEGITAVVLAPDNDILVPGTTAVVKTSGGKVVRPAAQLVLTFSTAALGNDVFPTSYQGGLAELERCLAEPRGAFSRAVAGTLPVLMQVDHRNEIQNALRFAERFGLRGALYGSRWAGELVEPIRASGLAVVMDPQPVGAEARAYDALVALSEAGVRIGFGLDSPGNDPRTLRFCAAAAVRAGLDREKALVALTGDAALIADAGGRIGRIEPGRDADMVLWSGHPLDLRSSVRAVWVDGKRVVGGAR